jgi:hypothetical protein
MNAIVGSVRTIDSPVESPTKEEIYRAVKTLNDHALTIYQILYANGLTAPGGGVFKIERASHMMNSVAPQLRITWSGKEAAFSFMTDNADDALKKAKIIVGAVEAKKFKKLSSRACCPLAEHRDCVCTESFSCVLHGSQCHGTHD